MKKNYLILSHKNCEQLERQIKSLDDGNSTFYIHIDIKADITLFRSLENIPSVFIIKERIDCIWGDFSMIKATLNLIENVLKNESEGMCILMSGNDYPIKSKNDINSFLEINNEKIFIDIKKKLWDNFSERTEYYRINLTSTRHHILLLKGFNIQSLKNYILGRISTKQFFKIVFKKRNLNLNMKFYGGSQWWAMDILKLSKVNDCIIKNKEKLFNFFSDSLIPDEFFFHTIIMHLKELGHPLIIEDNLTYVDWNRKNCVLPVTFEISDIKELIEQPENKLFARKFDTEIDEKVLDEIDKKLINN